jgi:hypothetical protein
MRLDHPDDRPDGWPESASAEREVNSVLSFDDSGRA